MKSLYQIKKAIYRKLYFLKKKTFRDFGKNSLIYKPILVTGKKNITIGNHVSIGEFARIEILSSWGENQQFDSSLVIGNNTTFEQFLHLTNAGKLTIGENCTFSSRVMITTINHKYNKINTNILSQELLVKDVFIGNYCFIGMDVKIFPGVTIGDNVIIGANSIVMNDLPSYTVCVGTPAKPIKKYNFENCVWEKIIYD